MCADCLDPNSKIVDRDYPRSCNLDKIGSFNVHSPVSCCFNSNSTGPGIDATGLGHTSIIVSCNSKSNFLAVTVGNCNVIGFQEMSQEVDNIVVFVNLRNNSYLNCK